MGSMNRQKAAGKIALVFIISILMTIPQLIEAAERASLREKEVIVLFEEPLRMAAEEVATLYPLIKKELEKRLTWSVSFIPTVLLIRESDTFQRMAGSHLVVAFAVPERNLMVIDYSKMRTDPFSIETTLKHELCHLLLHHHIKEENLPKWLDEGICQWVSDGIAEIIMTRKRSLLDEAILSGRYISVRALRDRFPHDKRRLVLAYEQSKSLVEYIMGSYGRKAMLAVLNDLREGSDLDLAIMQGFSISMDELEARWHDDLKRRITWPTYLISHLYEILFFLAALATTYGFIRRWLKKRAYTDEEEEEDLG